MVGATTNDQTAMIYGLFGPRLSSVKLVSRQRPRKGVRLGKRGRRLALAASIGEALDATKHWRDK